MVSTKQPISRVNREFEGGLGITAEQLKAYLFGKNIVSTDNPEYFSAKVSHQILSSIPPQIRLGPSSIPGNRCGVYSTVWLTRGTQMGPFIGDLVPISALDWSRHNDMMWEVFDEYGELSHFLDACNAPPTQTWVSLVGVARCESEQNLEIVQRGQDLYYSVTKPIAPGTELLVWYSDDVTMYMGLPGIEPRTQRLPTHTAVNHKEETQTADMDGGTQKVKCVICRRGFNSRSNLRSHMRIHTLEKPFLCKFCGRSFSQSSTLRNHMRLHTGEKPYRCSTCESSYSQLAGLRAHQKSARHRPHFSDSHNDHLTTSDVSGL